MGGAIERIDRFVGNGGFFFEIGRSASGGGGDTAFGLETLDGLDLGKHSAVTAGDHGQEEPGDGGCVGR